MIKNGKNIALSDFETAMGLWRKYGFEYRIILDEYRFYLRIKKELGIKNITVGYGENKTKWVVVDNAHRM